MIFDQLDEEDLRTIEGEACITDFGIQTALGIAKMRDKDTSQLEADLELIHQQVAN